MAADVAAADEDAREPVGALPRTERVEALDPRAAALMAQACRATARPADES